MSNENGERAYSAKGRLQMRAVIAVTLTAALSGAANVAVGQLARECARTVPDLQHDTSQPAWYGGDGLAVALSRDGVWSTTAPGAAIAEKVFWWSPAFRPGTESSLKIDIKNLHGRPMTARASKPTNAYLGSLEELGEAGLFRDAGSLEKGKWTMLVGMDFPDPGCWQITGEYLGQTLTFVVETVQVPSRAARSE